jgi:hypothetical protein
MACQGKLIVTNGDANGRGRLSSALIVLNGQQVFGPSAFNQGVYTLEAAVTVAPENSLSVILGGGPRSQSFSPMKLPEPPSGGHLTVQVVLDITPDATTTQIVGIGGGTVSVQNHLGDTFALTIPPLALDQDTSISVSTLPSALPSPIADNAWPGVVLEPEGLLFSLPVVMTVTLHNTPQNPNPAMLFWYKDSTHLLPIGNQTISQNSVAGQSYHFSTWTAGFPTSSELSSLIGAISSAAAVTSANPLDIAQAMLTIAQDAQKLGYETVAQQALSEATTFATNAANNELKAPLPPDPCGQESFVQIAQLVGELQRLQLDDLANQVLLSRTCSVTVAPPEIDLFVGQTSQQAITATLSDPKHNPVPNATCTWYNDNPSAVTIAANISNNSCVPTGVGGGIANVSANCNEIPSSSSTKVPVCSLTGTWQGTYSGQTISCAASDSNGCCTQWGGQKVPAGPITVTFSQNGTNVSGAVAGVSFTGTNINGNVSLQTTVLGYCMSVEVPAGVGGTVSSDCSTFSGSFYVDRNRTIAGTFSLQRTCITVNQCMTF